MVRLALVGLGRWGKNIQRTLEALPDVELVSVEDDIDGVLIATPGSTHAEVALPFIERGLPVFIEKPLATSMADAQKIAEAAAKSGAQIFVGHIHLYNPAYLKVKELLPSLGDIRLLYFEGMNNGPYRDDMSALWDWAPHDVVVALDLLGSEPTAIKSSSYEFLRPGKNLPDMTVAHLDFAGGMKAILSVSWLMPEKRKKLTIVGSTSSLVWDDTAEKKIILYENMGPKVGEGVEWQQPTISYPEYDKTAPLTAEMMAFVEMVKTKQPPKTDVAQGIQVVKIIEAIEQVS
jgi:predicted dehydrogenase